MTGAEGELKRSVDLDQATEAIKKSMLSLSAIADMLKTWCDEVYAPPLCEEGRLEIAALLRTAAGTPWWRDEFKPLRERDKDLARARRIAAALRVLKADLPSFIETRRNGAHDVPLLDTLQLQHAVGRHQTLIDSVKPRGPGASSSPERSLAVHISGRILALWDGKNGHAHADAVANKAMAWLTGRKASVTDGAIRKGRNRRT